MNIEKSPEIVSVVDDQFVERAFADVERVTLLRELIGGKTHALVLLVDIAARGAVPTEDALPSGQFVLKLDKRRKEWPDEPVESERHRRAATWDQSGEFARRHIPKLRHSYDDGDSTAMLYDVAGLSQLRLASYQHLGSGAHAECCNLVSRSLLHELNAAHTVESGVSARRSLEDWLGYRLDPVEGERMYAFAETQTSGRRAYTHGGFVYLNPLWVCNAKVLADDETCTRFMGLQHGDLHTGNILFDRTNPVENPFWIIDWALSRPGPLFFDHAYFETSLLLRELSGKPRERLHLLLDAADNVNQPKASFNVPQEHMAIAASLREIRKSLWDWQELAEVNRHDPFVAQLLLARVAAGLNWTNKPIAENERCLAFHYAARAATEFMRLFHRSEFDDAMRDADTGSAGAVESRRPGEASVPAVPAEVWNDSWDRLGGFQDSEFAYVLITGALRDDPDASSLGFLPWSVVMDLDGESDVNGLHSLAAKVLDKRRSLSWFGKELLPVNFERGTAWMMANGWPSRREEVPSSLDSWRREYLRKIRELTAMLRAGTSPRPVKVVVLATQELNGEFLGRLVEAMDEELGDSAAFILVSGIDRDVQRHPLIKHQLPMSVPAFLKGLRHVFGLEEGATAPQLPGQAGPVDIPIDTLRHWEEDLDVLHSGVLDGGESEDGAMSTFLRGMPPTWNDLAAQLDVPRDIGPDLLSTLETRLLDGRSVTIELHHSPGAGGTTAALRAVWTLRSQHPTAVLRRYSRLTTDRIDAIYQRTQKPVLMLADASDLPGTTKEELFRDLTRRNARLILLYLIRSSKSTVSEPLTVVDPMSLAEARRFLEVYEPRCRNEDSRRRLRRIAAPDDIQWESHRSAFFFGLTTFEEDFLSVDRYVRTHLEGIKPLARQTILYLALTTRYSQKGLSEAFFRRLFQPALSGAIVLEQALGDGPARLVVAGNGRVKLVHPLIAEETLRQLLGGRGRDDWKFNLKDLCIQLIRDVVAVVGSYSDEAKELFEQLFIYRGEWALKRQVARRQFSPLIEAIDSVDGQHQILTLLTEVCEREPHYWNHRGRHLIYKTNENFAKAEGFLMKAVELSKEQDALHFHALGMVRRFWIKDILDDMFRKAHTGGPPVTAVGILESIAGLATSALDAFAKARGLSSEDDHNYITPIQTILMVAERICRAAGQPSIAAICAGGDDVAVWLQRQLAEAEELLASVRQLRGERKKAGHHEEKCSLDLQSLYGDFDELIVTWEKVLDGSAEQSWLRRAMARAYLARRDRLWTALGQQELRKIVELAECNLSYDPTSESDLRVWFQAYHLMPEFSYNEAIDRLQAWASRSDSADAHFYLYILHFLRWRSGGERDEELIHKHLQRSAELAVGRRDRSPEWVALAPDWCPLVNARELGGWDDQKNFFKDTSKLAFVEGTISSLKRTGGMIRIGDTTRAFFVPPANLRESEHINAKVHFFLGFAYERLHAWVVQLGPVPAGGSERSDGATAVRSHPKTIAAMTTKSSAAGGNRPASCSERVASGDLRSQVHAVIKELVDRSISSNKPLHLAAVGIELSERFPDKKPIHTTLRQPSLAGLVRSFTDFMISGDAPRLFVEYRDKGRDGLAGRPQSNRRY
ncbi:MAG: phosphotransferase [Pirellulaceae bacterium]|nr:phosphotransferase [Pirellulaceae bacterium]